MVPGGGVEPPRPEGRRILSPLRLPVPPSRLLEGVSFFHCTAEVGNFEYGCEGLCRLRTLHGRRDRGQFHAEDRAAAGLALHHNGTSVLDRDPLGDGETKTGAALFSAARLVDAVETLEYFALLLRVDSRAGVLYGNCQALGSMFQSQMHRAG